MCVGWLECSAPPEGRITFEMNVQHLLKDVGWKQKDERHTVLC